MALQDKMPEGCDLTALVMQVRVPDDEAYASLLTEALGTEGANVVEHFGGKHFTCLHGALGEGDAAVPLYLDVLRPHG